MRHILQAIDASPRRLGTDYVDLYQIHRWDPETHFQETLEVLHAVVKSGKARDIGASSMYAWQFARSPTWPMCTIGRASSRSKIITTRSTGRKSVRCCPCAG